MINNQASLNDQFHPRLVVDETDGKLVVVYYDTVGDPMRVRTDVWTQSSSNDGMTWSTPDKVTTAQTDEMVGMGFDLYNQYGDYIGLSGYAGLFYASWTDRRSGGREEIWAAPIAIVVNVGIVAGVTSTPSGVYVFAKGADGLIYWMLLGDPFSGWTAMPSVP